jgi:hypothetical protein
MESKLMRSLCVAAFLASLLAGCASEYVVLHSVTGEPLVIARRASTSAGCISEVQKDASYLGVTLRYIHMRGTTFGRSLLWPFEAGYACEGAIGPEARPSGVYPIEAYFKPQGS